MQAAQVRAQRRDGVGEGSHHTALAGQHSFAVHVGEELHVFGQHAVFVLGVGIDLHEAQDQFLQLRLWCQAHQMNVLHQGFQPRHVATGDLRQERVFVGDVVVQRGLGHSTCRCQRAHRAGGVAAAGEELCRGCQHLIALRLEAG